MGKLGLLLVAAFIFAGGFMLFQSSEAERAIDGSQSVRQANILARQVAESGMNELIAKVNQRKAQQEWETLGAFMEAVGFSAEEPLERSLDHGQYKAWVEGNPEASGNSEFQMYSKGYYSFTDPITGESQTAEHRVQLLGQLVKTATPPDNPDNPDDPDDPDDPEDPGQVCEGTDLCVECSESEEECADEYQIKARFINSRAGYCSAIYLQQIIPDSDASNGYRVEYAMMFPSGHNRDGYEQTFAQTVIPGTQLNFILAVDQNCSSEHSWSTPIGSDSYNYLHPAFNIETDDLTSMTAGVFAMIEGYATNDKKWRIAYEDIQYTPDQLVDIKTNGYGDGSWDRECLRYSSWNGSCREWGDYTYGGNGWDYSGADNLRVLRDFGNQPDFDDQVIEVELIPHVEEEEQQPA